MSEPEELKETISQALAVATDRMSPPRDEHSDYAMARLHVAQLLEDLTGDKIKALEILRRFEAGLWATALLYNENAAQAHQSFGVGFDAFCKELKT